MELTARQARTRADLRLVRRIQSDSSAEGDFRTLYERYAGATFAFFLRKVGDPDAASDLNQDLYLRLSRSIHRFEARCSWRTWVFLIARNVLADARAQRWQKIADRTVTLDAEEFGGLLSLDLDADEEARSVLLRDRLRLCLTRLSELARAVVLGHYFEGVTLREMTERLGLRNPSGSRGVLLGAQRKLRRCIEGEEDS